MHIGVRLHWEILSFAQDDIAYCVNMDMCSNLIQVMVEGDSSLADKDDMYSNLIQVMIEGDSSLPLGMTVGLGRTGRL